MGFEAAKAGFEVGWEEGLIGERGCVEFGDGFEGAVING